MPTAAGNPSAAMGPAERAAQMGLQSDGSGNYIDPESGQTVARTVNGELVFYDNNRATGGAISDSSGGAQLTQASPSWSDPMTGNIVVPPSRPESPEEQGAVPDPVPASAPQGYDSFVQQSKMDAYKGQEAIDMGKKEVGMGMAPQGAPQGGGDPNITPISPDGKVYTGAGLGGGLPGVSESLGDNADMNQALQKKAQEKMADRMAQSQQSTFQNFTDRQKMLQSRLDAMNTPSTLKSGAGANQLSLEDIGKFRNYIKNGPQVKPEAISPEDLDWGMNYLKNNAGSKWKGLQNRLKGKGDPSPDRKVVSRAREVVESYLSNFGQSAIDGSELPFSESELDHGISLSNGGLDQGDNWRWLPKRFNQFKGDMDDEALLAALDREEARQNDPDFKLKTQGDQFVNDTRDNWKERFGGDGWEALNVADIRQAKGAQGLQMLKALAEKAGVSYYKNREGPRASGRAGGGTQLGVEELQDRLIDQLGIPDTADIETFDRGLFEVLQKIEDQRYELDQAKRARKKEKKLEKAMGKVRKVDNA